MLSTILVMHPWLTTVALLGVAGFGPLAARVLAGHTRIARALTLASLALLVVLTLWPDGPALGVRCEVDWSLPTLRHVEPMANVVLFAVPALLATAWLRRPVTVVACGAAVSALIETVQALVPAIGRSCDTGDWLVNTIGAAGGALLGGIGLAIAVRHERMRGAVDATR